MYLLLWFRNSSCSLVQKCRYKSFQMPISLLLGLNQYLRLFLTFFTDYTIINYFFWCSFNVFTGIELFDIILGRRYTCMASILVYKLNKVLCFGPFDFNSVECISFLVFGLVVKIGIFFYFSVKLFILNIIFFLFLYR